MNAQVEKTLNPAEKLMTDAGSEILEWLKAAGDMVAVQAPELANEFVRWGMVGELGNASLLIIAALTIGIVGYRLSKYLWAEHKKSNTDDDFAASIVTFASSAFTFMFTMFAAHSLVLAAQIYVAPRVYIVKEVARLLN